MSAGKRPEEDIAVRSKRRTGRRSVGSALRSGLLALAGLALLAPAAGADPAQTGDRNPAD